MNAYIEKTIKEILAETEIPITKSDTAKAGITPENFEALKQIWKDGYMTPLLGEIVNGQEIRKKIYAEKIHDVYFDQATITMLKEYMTRKGAVIGSARMIETADQKAPSVQAFFKQDCIDGIALLSNHGVAIYRTGLQLPSVIFCHSAEEAKQLYENIKGAL
jgi:hypothetical protein